MLLFLATLSTIVETDVDGLCVLFLWHVLCLDCGALCSSVVPEIAVPLFGVGYGKVRQKGTGGKIKEAVHVLRESGCLAFGFNRPDSYYRLVLNVLGGLLRNWVKSRCAGGRAAR